MNMVEYKRLHDTLKYKNERAVEFDIFLTQCNNTYNIYEKWNEPVTDEYKLWFLFNKLEHTS